MKLRWAFKHGVSSSEFQNEMTYLMMLNTFGLKPWEVNRMDATLVQMCGELNNYLAAESSKTGRR